MIDKKVLEKTTQCENGIGYLRKEWEAHKLVQTRELPKITEVIDTKVTEAVEKEGKSLKSIENGTEERIRVIEERFQKKEQHMKKEMKDLIESKWNTEKKELEKSFTQLLDDMEKDNEKSKLDKQRPLNNRKYNDMYDNCFFKLFYQKRDSDNSKG